MAPLGVSPSKPPWRRSSPPAKFAAGLVSVPPPVKVQPASLFAFTSVAGFRPSWPLSPLSPFCGGEPWTVAPVAAVSPLSPLRPGVPAEASALRTPDERRSVVMVPFLMSRPWIVPSLILPDVISDPAAAVPVHARTTAKTPRITPGDRRLRIHPPCLEQADHGPQFVEPDGRALMLSA